MSHENQVNWHMKQTMQKMETELKVYGRALDMRATQVGALCAALESLIPQVADITEEQTEKLMAQVAAYRNTLPEEKANVQH